MATHRVMAFARAADVPVHVVHLSSRGGAGHVPRREGGRRPGDRRDVPALPDPHRRTATTSPTRSTCAAVRHLAAAPPGRGPRRAVGRARRRRRSTSSPRTTSPTGSAVEKAEAARGVPFDQISNGAPGIETLLAIVYAEGVAKGRMTRRAHGRPARDHARPPVRPAREGRDRGRQRRGPRRCSTLRRTGRSAPPTSTTRATTRRTKGSRSAGAVRTVFVRGRAVIRDGAFVGQRGFGRIVDRGPILA